MRGYWATSATDTSLVEPSMPIETQTDSLIVYEGILGHQCYRYFSYREP